MTSKSPAFRTSARLALLAAAVASGCFFLPTLTFAHPEIEAQLAHVSKQIEASPEKAELFLQRGHLHRVHRDWQKALADFRKATELEPELYRIVRATGRLYLEADKAKQALEQLHKFLELVPGDPDGLILRGRAQGKLGEPLKAAADFDAALLKLRRPTPELFIERAKILSAGGEKNNPRALAGLAQGIGKLGDLYTLHRYAAELEISAGQPEAALRRARQLVDKTKGQLQWRILEAELLTSMQKPEAARAAYQQALEKVTSLPPHRRRAPAVAEAEKSIRGALAKLAVEAE